MKKRSPVTILCIVLSSVLAVSSATLFIVWLFSDRKTYNPIYSADQVFDTTGKKTDDGWKSFLIKTENKIDTSLIEDGLNDMGFLITEEYYFTEVVTNVKEKKLFSFLKIGEASYSVRYDGVVYCGVDFSGITVSVSGAILTVYVPKAKIQSVDIDFNSFQCLSSKDGLWTHMDVSDYNDSLMEMKQTAKDNAVGRGVIERAETNAAILIRQFAEGLINDPGVSVRVITEG